MTEVWKCIVSGREHVRFRQSDFFCPYHNAKISDVEEAVNGNYEIEVNAYYRYEKFMQSLFENEKFTKQEKAFLFDIFMHYFVELEFRSGLTRQEYAIAAIMQQLLRGDFGTDIKELYEKLLKEQQYKIAHALYQQRKSGTSMNRFTDTLIALLKTGAVYRDKVFQNRLYLYVGKRETEEYTVIIEVIKKLFLPFGYEVSVCWENPFAILGERQTVKLGMTQLI